MFVKSNVLEVKTLQPIAKCQHLSNALKEGVWCTLGLMYHLCDQAVDDKGAQSDQLIRDQCIGFGGLTTAGWATTTLLFRHRRVPA